MTVQKIDAAAALAGLDGYSAVIDARSEGEYALDHLPGALNWPSLNDAERVRVGTLYKQTGPFEASKVGAALVAANIARHLQAHAADLPRTWRPMVYCWRGGKRSGALALVLDQIGFKVSVIDGGYKAFRAALVQDLATLPQRFNWRVICGPTGAGKTRLLGALADAGAQTLDLEDLAAHRSSVLGFIPGTPQPSQKAFETALWQRLRKLDPTRPVFVESESRKVGNVAVPETLMQAMRASPCVDLQLPMNERVALLLEDYAFLAQDRALFAERLETLVALRGRDTVRAWQALIAQGRVADAVHALLEQHYDPGYRQSIRRNFVQFADARPLPLENRSNQALASAALALVAM